VNGEELTLLPDKAIYWKRKKNLLLSDLHLAKSGHFRKAGIALPSSIHKNDLSRLSKIIDEFPVEKVYLLGDLFHSKENKEWKQF
jgi:metallophosphoesterase superfamily enzyme